MYNIKNILFKYIILGKLTNSSITLMYILPFLKTYFLYKNLNLYLTFSLLIVLTLDTFNTY